MAVHLSYPDSKPRVFSPVVIIHNDQQPRSYIGGHKERIEEMLFHNAKEWTGYSYAPEPVHYEADRESVSSDSSCSSASLSPSPTYAEAPSSFENSSEITTPTKPNQKKRRGNLPKAVTAILKSWLAKHVKHPYPTEDEKISLAMETKLTMNQISNWFINARRRILQPMIESAQANGELGRQGCDLELIQFSGEAQREETSSSKRRYSSGSLSKKSSYLKKQKLY
ncbi:Homeodomain-like protein [Basidiobolus meristosporus CBS 931.73]|uniref:Homeodomain-like protein n=1 Tax=Basidiobolus meristosporus CBS 931.73 TaxID=1314790 RepID=A0A1Y1Z3N4_9FUNG|nr:Homeodomain-like protein [Basidiobolus meristosporus CBS 931.73]|eukprot:ORY04839.1 Homeodomain-like protein [Basidiobolus meristosporus CBS 931.73]